MLNRDAPEPQPEQLLGPTRAFLAAIETKFSAAANIGSQHPLAREHEEAVTLLPTEGWYPDFANPEGVTMTAIRPIAGKERETDELWAGSNGPRILASRNSGRALLSVVYFVDKGKVWEKKNTSEYVGLPRSNEDLAKLFRTNARSLLQDSEPQIFEPENLTILVDSIGSSLVA